MNTAWSITRRATDRDYELLEKRAAALVKRLDLSTEDEGTAVGQVEAEISWLQRPDADEIEQMCGRDLERRWKRIANRAIGDDGIAHGYVGHSVE